MQMNAPTYHSFLDSGAYYNGNKQKRDGRVVKRPLQFGVNLDPPSKRPPTSGYAVPFSDAAIDSSIQRPKSTNVSVPIRRIAEGNVIPGDIVFLKTNPYDSRKLKARFNLNVPSPFQRNRGGAVTTSETVASLSHVNKLLEQNGRFDDDDTSLEILLSSLEHIPDGVVNNCEEGDAETNVIVQGIIIIIIAHSSSISSSSIRFAIVRACVFSCAPPRVPIVLFLPGHVATNFSPQVVDDTFDMQKYAARWRKNAANAPILSKIYIFLRVCKKEISGKTFLFLKYEVWSQEDAYSFVRNVQGFDIFREIVSIWKLGSVVDTRAGGADKKTLVVNVVQTYSLTWILTSFQNFYNPTENVVLGNFLKHKTLLQDTDSHKKSYEDARLLKVGTKLDEEIPFSKDFVMIVLKQDFNGTPTKFQLLTAFEYFVLLPIFNVFDFAEKK
jgi:hypothetical protein